MSNPTITAPLGQGAGYGVVVGLGALFAIGMIFISNTLAKRGNLEDTEEFTVAKRQIGTGLTAAAVISSWTWSTTLLSSCNVAYEYGVAGAFFYIMVFSNLAIETKRKAPNAHTFLEILRVRYGTFVHISFMFFSLAANTLVVSSVLLGGSAAISALTGINVYGALWLLPASVAAYTLRGGLRATILTDYLHTAIILIVILMFWFSVYVTGNKIGSPDAMYNLLQAAQVRNHDAPTKDNSYVTIHSLGALKFAILSILEYTGVVFLDNSFHQKGIAADPASAVPGYILGGISWYAMPFTLATTMGLVAVALENTPSFPTYPRRMTAAETNAGLVLPYAAQTIMGKGGAAAVLLLMFMSCTSAISAQLIGVSTVISYDIYRTYFRPNANDEHLLRASHHSVVGFSLWMAGFSSMLFGAGIDLSFIYNMTGIFTGPALPPLVGTFFSSRQGPIAAATSIWGGFVTGIVVWLTLAQQFSGVVNITSVGDLDPCLYGCVAGIASSAVITCTLSLIFPAHYTWESLAAIRIQTENDTQVDITVERSSYDTEKLRKAAHLARGVTLFLFLALFIVWPLSMYGNGYIFSKTFFRGWVIVSVLWAVFAIFAVTVFPIFEGRSTLISIVESFFPDKNQPVYFDREDDETRMSENKART